MPIAMRMNLLGFAAGVAVCGAQGGPICNARTATLRPSSTSLHRRLMLQCNAVNYGLNPGFCCSAAGTPAGGAGACAGIWAISFRLQ